MIMKTNVNQLKRESILKISAFFHSQKKYIQLFSKVYFVYSKIATEHIILNENGQNCNKSENKAINIYVERFNNKKIYKLKFHLSNETHTYVFSNRIEKKRKEIDNNLKSNRERIENQKHNHAVCFLHLKEN